MMYLWGFPETRITPDKLFGAFLICFFTPLIDVFKWVPVYLSCLEECCAVKSQKCFAEEETPPPNFQLA